MLLDQCPLQRGFHQVVHSPLSPKLFYLALELLATVIRNKGNLGAIKVEDSGRVYTRCLLSTGLILLRISAAGKNCAYAQ